MSVLTLAEIQSLAPSNLPQLRKHRYDGGGMNAELGAFGSDAEKLRAVYKAIQRLSDVLSGMMHSNQISPPFISALKSRPEIREIVRTFREIESIQQFPPRLRTILHDLRGGSLLALLTSIQLLDPSTTRADGLLRTFFYARDHLKMMRNAVSDIDPTLSERDNQSRVHTVDLLREKWFGRTFAYDGVEHAVSFDCSWEGPIAESCLEFSALDRVIYNLMNNAARYTIDRHIGITVLELDSGQQANVRLVVHNRISPQQANQIMRLTAGDPDRLLCGGITTGGNGVGMSICAEFVQNAFGLFSTPDAIAGGYVGVKLIREVFVVWFHWPRVDPRPAG